jgi:ubiquitin-like 1-activating enzyme E1 B
MNADEQIAKESAEKFNHKGVNIVSHHANIKDAQFSVPFFAAFTIVFNALDNVDARRHVNKMCVAADVPMVDCGTTGFRGHTQVIKKGIFMCYDCVPKDAPKSFPVCTIRSTPSQPIHCIVWAKSYLFSEVFGVSEDDMPELDFSEDSENQEEIAKLREEAMALKKIRESSKSPDFSRKIFDKVFKDDINRLLSMEDMWKSRHPPKPFNYDELLLEKEAAHIDGAATAHKHQSVWSHAESFAVFLDSVKRLQERMNAENREEGTTVLSFDKDDADTLDFVVASGNLRSYIFGIETRSKWDVKRKSLR